MNKQKDDARQQPEDLLSSAMLFKATFLDDMLDVSIEDEGIFIGDRYVPYSEMTGIAYVDDPITVTTFDAHYDLLPVGDTGDLFFKTLCESFNAKIQQVLGATTEILFEMRGPRYVYDDHEGHACFRVFEDALLLLPPNLDARRLPFSQIESLDRDDASVTLALLTGESFVFSMLDDQMDAFYDLLTKLWEKAKASYPEGLLIWRDAFDAFPQIKNRLPKEILKGIPEAVGYKINTSATESDLFWQLVFSQDESRALVVFSSKEELPTAYVFDAEGKDSFLLHFNRAFEVTSFKKERLVPKEQSFAAQDMESEMLLLRSPFLQRMQQSFRAMLNDREYMDLGALVG